ncbi:MAG: hypothetical protein A2Y10_05630 [Planctomycetes bacterium GWF2_41_51]|nr:MAG: hypothetical protein A2Y10_05630 [Planctomycetes bacterium GWF2_41_51]
MRRKITKNCDAFTLVELLVVISIIAVLLAVLMPALSKARESAKGVICGTRLKNVGLALEFYSKDWDGHIMPYYRPSEPTGIGRYWIGKLLKYFPTQKMASSDSGTLTTEIVFCPSFEPFDIGKAESWAKCYGMRLWGIDIDRVPPGTWTEYQKYQKTLNVRATPAEFFLVADSVRIYTKTGATPTQNFAIYNAAHIVDTDIYVHVRHGRGVANTLFMDLHVGPKDKNYFNKLHVTQKSYFLRGEKVYAWTKKDGLRPKEPD